LSAGPRGNYDRILDFSTAVTGNLFFVPSATFLDDVADPSSEAVTTSPSTASVRDGSLGIGSLKGNNSHE
jgi:putative iron-dependent peroxidase